MHSAAMVTRRVRTDGFIDPCIPTLAAKPPSGPGWVHEIKHDGYRLSCGGIFRSRVDPPGIPSSHHAREDMPNLFALMSDGANHPPLLSPLRAGFYFPLEAMEDTGKSKAGEAARTVAMVRADARASELAHIVEEIRRDRITSWYGIARELNRRGIPTVSGRGIWDPSQVTA